MFGVSAIMCRVVIGEPVGREGRVGFGWFGQSIYSDIPRPPRMRLQPWVPPYSARPMTPLHARGRHRSPNDQLMVGGPRGVQLTPAPSGDTRRLPFTNPKPTNPPCLLVLVNAALLLSPLSLRSSSPQYPVSMVLCLSFDASHIVRKSLW